MAQDPHDIFHVTTVQNHNPDVIDPWHYEGGFNFPWPQDAQEKLLMVRCGEFLRLCRIMLSHRALPFTLGSTGYLDFKDDIVRLPNAWCLDELGRVVILLNGVLMFQRYKADNQINILTGTMRGAATSENIDQFMALLAK